MRLRSIVAVLILAWLITVIFLLARHHDQPLLQPFIKSVFWADISAELGVAEKGGPLVGDLKHHVLTRAAEDARLADELMAHLASNAEASREPFRKSTVSHSTESNLDIQSISRSKIVPKKSTLPIKLPKDFITVAAPPAESHAAIPASTAALHSATSITQQIGDVQLKNEHSSPPTLNPASLPHAASLASPVLPKNSAPAEDVVTAGVADEIHSSQHNIQGASTLESSMDSTSIAAPIDSHTAVHAVVKSLPDAPSESQQVDESSTKDQHSSLLTLKQDSSPHTTTLASASLHVSRARIEDVLTAGVIRSGEKGSSSGPAAKKKQSSCTRVILDDGYGAIPNTYVVVGQVPSSSDTRATESAEQNGQSEVLPQPRPNTAPLLLEVVSGDLCAAKTKCQASSSCAGFVWWAALQEAQLLRRLPPKDQWKSHAEGAKSGAQRRQMLGKVISDQGQATLPHSGRGLSRSTSSSSTSSSSSSDLLPQGRHKRKSSTELKKEAKDKAQAMASTLQQQQVGLGPVLYAKLASGDTLTHLLGHYDRRCFPNKFLGRRGGLTPSYFVGI